MDRRNFLKTGVAGFAGGCACWAVGGLSLTHSQKASAAPVSIDLSVAALQLDLNATKNVQVWKFVDLTLGGPNASQPQLVVQQGDQVTINIQNTLATHSIKLKIPGIDNSNWPSVAPGAIGVFEFTAIQAGSYVIYDDQNGRLGRAMGLSMPLVVLPADVSGGLYAAAPPEHIYDKEYIVHLNELDSRINDAVAAGLPVDMTTFQPDYFFVNGLRYPDTVYTNGAVDINKVILMSVNTNVAIRFINGGLLHYPMHFHGYHTNVVLRDRILETAVVEKDTVLVKPAESVDTILPVGSQTGLYPLHTHYVPGVTDAGSYAGGALLMLQGV